MQGGLGSRVDGGDGAVPQGTTFTDGSLPCPRLLCCLVYFPQSLSQKCVVPRSLYSCQSRLEPPCLGLNPCSSAATSPRLSNLFVKQRARWCLLHKGVVRTE